MAPGKKTGGRDFKDGNPGGPGKPRLLPEIVGAPRIDKDSYNRLLNETLHSTQSELQAIINDEKKPMIAKWLAAVVAKGAVHGDTGRLEALLSRAIGPVPRQDTLDVELTHKVDRKELIEVALKLATQSRSAKLLASNPSEGGVNPI